MKLKLFFILFSVLLTACGSDDNGSNGAVGNGGSDPGISALNQGKIQFYKTSGNDSDLVPYHAIRIYDNVINSYSFWKYCSPLSELKLHSSQISGDPDNLIAGPETFGSSCDIDVTFDYSGSTPVAVGEIKRNGSSSVVDLDMVKITENEFKSLLADPSSGFEKKYNSSVSMRRRLDQMCTTLFGSDCDISVL